MVVSRLYLSAPLGKAALLRLRVENLFDAEYEEIHGYPALGFGAFAGIERRF